MARAARALGTAAGAAAVGAAAARVASGAADRAARGRRRVPCESTAEPGR